MFFSKATTTKKKKTKHPTAAFVVYSESPASESEGAQSSPVKNKHSEDDPAEAEEHEVKRLKFDKEGEARDAPNQTASSEVSLGMGEETETSSTSQDKEKDATCARQRCTEEEEEGISHFLLYFLVHFPRRLDFLCRKPVLLGLLIVSCSGFFFFFFF